MPDASSVPVIWIVLAAIAAAVIGVIVLDNQLVAMDVRCDNVWSDIDVQLGGEGLHKPRARHARRGRRRTVAGDGGQGAAAGRGRRERPHRHAQDALRPRGGLPRPQGQHAFTHRQEQLAWIEDSIQASRRYFNATARDLNGSVRMFPWSLLAGAARAKPREFFEITDAAERAVPSVKMG